MVINPLTGGNTGNVLLTTRGVESGQAHDEALLWQKSLGLAAQVRPIRPKRGGDDFYVAIVSLENRLHSALFDWH